MSYIFFNDVLAALGKRLNYEAVINLFGNAFAKDANKVVQAANPLYKASGTNSAAAIMALGGKITVIEGDKKEQKKSAEKALGDISWFEEYLK